MKPFLRACSAASLAVCLAAPAAAATIPDETIQKAVERGAAALRRHAPAVDGGVLYGTGPTSLAALALLECGATPDDELVRKLADVVRNDSPTQTRVYSVALAIMFLDRLGDPRDEWLIQALSVRLLEGQSAVGGWGYTTRDVESGEVQRLKAMVGQGVELRTAPDPGKGSARPGLDPELADRVGRIRTRPAEHAVNPDNSNTQFAVLAAWIARRHGIPADLALKRTERYFRATNVRGMWPYVPDGIPDARIANTCSGLLGLAVGAGVSVEAKLRTGEGKGGPPPALRDPLKDAMVQVAMNIVGANVADMAVTGPTPDRGLYFLWSVERVAMVYGVQHMGRVDWYQQGAGIILRLQQADGSWQAGSVGGVSIPGEVSTAFALLFLRRSNFAGDLTAALRAKSGQATLRAGGDKGESDAAPEKSEATALAGELPNAAPDRRAAIIAELRDHKGADYTDALAHVIPRLAGDVQKNARDALAERMARMTVATVREKLHDADAEVRRASALACAMKDDKGFIPDLIGTLDDGDQWVVRAAAVALRTLTAQDFGPAAHSSPADRAKAIAAWRNWWKQHKGQ